jgi:hypothetical protein
MPERNDHSVTLPLFEVMMNSMAHRGERLGPSWRVPDFGSWFRLAWVVSALTTATAVYFGLYAQDDGGGDWGYDFAGDPGYSTDGNPGSYSTDQSGGFLNSKTYYPWPAPPTSSDPSLQTGQGSSGPSSPNSGSSSPTGPAVGNYTPITGGPPSAPSSGDFDVGVSGGNNSAQGSQPSPTAPPMGSLPAVPNVPVLVPGTPDPDIEPWIQQNASKMSPDDYTKAQQISKEIGALSKNLSENPLGDLAQELGGAAGAVADPFLPKGSLPNEPREMPEFPDRPEEIINNWDQLNKDRETLRQIRNSNNIPPDLVPANPSSAGGESQPQIDWQSLSPDKILSNNLLSPFGVSSENGAVQESWSPNAPGDPGGIDFRTFRLVYLSEVERTKPGAWTMRSFASGVQAVRSVGGVRIKFLDASRLAARAFYSLLTIPDRDLWVNLHPAEPDRIISASLGQTDVGRIMLQADFQLKKDAGLLMRREPFASAERELVRSSVLRRTGLSNTEMRWGSTGRVEISSGSGRVFARQSKTGIFIEGVILDVVFEQKALRVSINRGGEWVECEIGPDEWKEFVRLTQVFVRPLLIQRVNQAPEYESLRQIFSARVLADWYKRNHPKHGTLSALIDANQLSGLRSAVDWSAVQIWRNFKRDYDTGSFRGYGGVNFTRLPQARPFQPGPSLGAALLAKAMRSGSGLWQRRVYRAGDMFFTIERPSGNARILRWFVVLVLLGLAGKVISEQMRSAGRRRTPGR